MPRLPSTPVPRRARRVRALVVLVMLLLAPGWAAGAPEAQETVATYIVGFHDLPENLSRGDSYRGGTVTKVEPILGYALVETSQRGWDAEARQDASVAYVEPRGTWEALFTPNDPRYSDMYGPQQVRADLAWDAHLGSTDKSVCIVDTGVRYTHEDLAGARWKGGTDVVNGDNDPWDDHGHGTHVAGTAAASIDNGKGVAGMGNVGIYGVKVLSSSGSGYYDWVADGIRWCADNGGDVISMSLGGSSGSSLLVSALDYAWSKGALIVAAAGNSGPCSNCIGYPAKYEQAMAITCTTSSEDQCSFSSDGPESELAAPGYNVLSTCYGSDASYCTMSGTSMSTPHVSGVAALIWSMDPAMSNAQLRQLMQETARDKGSAGWDALYGYGIVDARALLERLGPIADAGVDQHLEDSDNDGGEDVVLDGSGSRSSRTTIVAWDWFDANGNLLASGENVTVRLDNGNHTLRLMVTDNVSKTGNDTVDIRIDGNPPPVADAGPDQTLRDTDGTEAEPVRLDGSGSTDDGEIVDWYWTDAGRILGAGPVIDVNLSLGTHDVTLTVTDNVGLTGSDTVRIVVEPNQAPVADAGVNQTLRDTDGDGREIARLDGTLSTDDGSIMEHEWSEDGIVLGHGALLDAAFTPGTHEVTLRVTDNGGAVATDTLVVTVIPNQPPVAESGSDQALHDHDATGAETARLDASDSKDDGTIAAYEWLEEGATIATGQFAYPPLGVGTHNITLRVTDNAGVNATDTVRVVVHPNEPPVASAGPDRGATDHDGDGLEAFHLNGSASTDDGHIMEYTWSEGDTVLASGPVVDVVLGVGAHEVTLVVRDEGDALGSDTVMLTVAPNEPPTAVAGDDATLRDGDGDGREVARVNGTGSHDSDAVVAYEWRRGTQVLADTAVADVTLPVGVHTLTLVVTDSGGASASDDVVVDVRANEAPQARFRSSCDDVQCTFDASDSTDLEGPVASYAWDFGDGRTGDGITVVHRYDAYRNYTVTLTVRDAAGANHSTQAAVQVAEAPDRVAPSRPPSDVQIRDGRDGFVYQWGYPPAADVDVAWFEHDAKNLYVGMRLIDITVADEAAGHFEYQVAFEPGWRVEDPTWGGRVPAGWRVEALRAVATPAQPGLADLLAPTYERAFTLQALVRDPSDGDWHVRVLDGVGGEIRHDANIVWWTLPRNLLQMPGAGSVVMATSALSAPVQDATWLTAIDFAEGRDYALDPASAPHPLDAAFEFTESGNGFRVESDGARSEAAWDPLHERVYVRSNRDDPVPDVLSRPLHGAWTPDAGSWNVTADWRATSQGNWQRAVPLFVGASPVRNLDLAQSARNVAYVLYDSRDANLDHRPIYHLVYRDAEGVMQLRESFTGTHNVVYHFDIGYDQASRTLTLRIQNAAGSDLKVATHQVGTGDGFTFDKMGVATIATRRSSEPPVRGWVDDVTVRFEPTP